VLVDGSYLLVKSEEAGLLPAARGLGFACSALMTPMLGPEALPARSDRVLHPASDVESMILHPP